MSRRNCIFPPARDEGPPVFAIAFTAVCLAFGTFLGVADAIRLERPSVAIETLHNAGYVGANIESRGREARFHGCDFFDSLYFQARATDRDGYPSRPVVCCTITGTCTVKP